MIAGYSLIDIYGNITKALDLFERMKQNEIQPNVIT